MIKSLLAALFVSLCFQLGCSNQPNSNGEAPQTEARFQITDDQKKLSAVLELKSDSELQKDILHFAELNDRGEPILKSDKKIQLKAGINYHATLRFQPTHILAEHLARIDSYWDCESAMKNSLPMIFAQLSLPQSVTVLKETDSQTIPRVQLFSLA